MKFSRIPALKVPYNFVVMMLVTAAAFLLFWLRDYWLLQLGPSRSVARRVGIYAVLVSIAGLLVWVLASTHSTAQFISDIESPPWLAGLFAFHSIAAIACFWMKWTGRYHLAWLAAMVPAPVAWVLFARVLFTANDTIAEPVKGAVILVVASLLIAPILLTVLRGHRLEMGIDELDYVLGFAGWTNCFGAGLVVLAIPPAAVESFEIAIRALSVH
jgi:hypothetical protein